VKDYIKLYLDKKFPNRIQFSVKQHPKLSGVILQLYKSGEKRLFVKVIGGSESFYHYFEAHPEDLQIWFQLSYDRAEEKLHDWVSDRLKKQESNGIYGV
jgi:hypothetical protein